VEASADLAQVQAVAWECDRADPAEDLVGCRAAVRAVLARARADLVDRAEASECLTPAG